MALRVEKTASGRVHKFDNLHGCRHYLPDEDTDPDSRKTETTTPTELKKELEKLINLIVNKDDYAVLDELDKAISILFSLRELKIKESVPNEFKCPLSGLIMVDPVVVASGQTYDRPYIEEWFRRGHKTCPKTKQELTNSHLTPNDLLKNIIEQWRTELGFDQPKPGLLRDINDEATAINSPDLFGCLNSLLDNMSSSSLSSDQKSSAKTIRHLTKQYPPFRGLFGNEAVSKLLEPLAFPGNACLDLDLQQDIITTVFNISLAEGNKKLVAENPRVIPSLVNALRTGTLNTKSNAAAAVYELSRLDSNKTRIVESGALEPLIRLVGQGSPFTMPNVCAAMYMLCHGAISTGTHIEEAVSKAAVSVILRKVEDGAFLDLLLPVLAKFSRLPSAAAKMGTMGAVACLLKIMRESVSKDSMAVENCSAILFDICSHDQDKLKEVQQEEAANRTISNVVVWGTQRATRKAIGILKMGNNQRRLMAVA